MIPDKLGRYLRTVKHLTPSQFAHRARLVALRTSYRRLPRATRARYQRLANAQLAAWADWSLLPGAAQTELLDGLSGITEAIEEARSIASGKFRFINRTAELGEYPAWRDHGQSHLWSYHLHYFDYLISLGLWWRIERAPEALETAARLMSDWIEKNPPAQGDGWHPYPVAARLSNWLQGSELFGDSLRRHPLLEPVLLQSLTEQALFLEDNLEFDVLGNHLLKNVRALVHCGLSLDHPRSQVWLHRGALLTFKQVRHQVLDDGGHYERSPMYQLLVFWDLLDIFSQIRRAGITIPADVLDRFEAMLHWIAAMRHPDGDIPLFNDAVLGTAGRPEEALAAGSAFLDDGETDLSVRGRLLLDGQQLAQTWPSLHFARERRVGASGSRIEEVKSSLRCSGDVALPDSGYYIFSSGPSWLVADAGDPCPDELPAHAHADALSYEMSVNGQRLIVDGGVFEYQAGEWRDFLRGTPAHNTVMVDGRDQSEVWGSFRVGHRARVHARYWDEFDGVRVLEAEHDGYQSALNVRHRRWIARVDQRFFVISDLLEGYGEHEARSFIHLHPDATVGDASLNDTSRLIGAALGEAGLLIAPFGHDELDHYVGCLSSPRAWYAQEFGRRLPSTEVSLIVHGTVPRLFGYLLLLDSPTRVSAASEGPTRWCIDLAFHDRTYRIRANAAGVRVERR